MTDARLELAYSAALSILAIQDSTLANLRNRAGGLLSVAALVASFSAGVGILKTDAGGSLPDWAGITMLVVVVLIGAVAMAVLWPIKDKWCRGVSAMKVMKHIDGNSDIDGIRRYVIDELEDGKRANEAFLKRRAYWFQVGVVLLVLEVAVLVAGLIDGK